MSIKKLTLIVPFVIALAACEPPATRGGTINGWPKLDQPVSAQNLVRIEEYLNRLGYFRGTVDGTITDVTRRAISRYQRSIGAPSTGTVSAKLLRNLQSSYAKAPKRTATVRKTTTTKPRKTTYAAPKKTTTATSAAATENSFSEGGDDGGGGGGGGGWN